MPRPGNKRLLASQRSNGKNWIDRQNRFNNSIYEDIKKKQVIEKSKLVIGSEKNEKITIKTDGNDYTLTLNGDATLPVVGVGNVTGLTVTSQNHNITVTNNNTTAGDGTTNTLGDRTLSLGGNLTTVSNDITFDTGSAARTVRLGGDLTTVGSNITIDGNAHGNGHVKFNMNSDLKIGGAFGGSAKGDIMVSSNNNTARNVILGGDLTVENNNFAVDSVYGDSEIFMGADMLTIGDGHHKTGNITIKSDSTTARDIVLGGNLTNAGGNHTLGDATNNGNITISSNNANPRDIVLGGNLTTTGAVTEKAITDYTAVTHDGTNAGTFATVQARLDALSTALNKLVGELRGGTNNNVLIS